MPFTLLALLAWLPSCSTAAIEPASTEPQAEELRVLFIGNSLTAANNLPGMVEALARRDGRRLRSEALLGANLGLEDHWRRGEVRDRIAAGDWDLVVLQQGPSSLPENQKALSEWSRRFAQEIRAAGGRPALLMVWPSRQRSAAFDAVRDAYSAAAAAVDGALFPAGEAWRAAWRLDPSLALYGPDGFHPSGLGSYLAALVIYQGIFDRLPSDLEGGAGLPLTAAEAATLWSAVLEADEQHGRP